MKRTLCVLLAVLVLPLQAALAAPARAGTPQLTVTPGTVAPGGYITISGTNFPPSQPCTINVTVNSSGGSYSLTPTGIATDSTGKFTTSQLQLPAATTPGTYTAQAICGGSQQYAQFTVANSQVTFNPASPAPGATVTATGSGFAPGTTLTMSVTFNIAGGGTSPVTQSVTVGSGGGFTISFQVPPQTINSSYTVTFSQGSSIVKTATLTVGAQGTTITVSPASIPTGNYSQFSVAGTGFLVGEKVDVQYTAKFSDNTTQVIQGSQIVDSNGNFSNALLTVLSNTAPGTYIVTATGESSHRTATANLIVTPSVTITTSPASAPAGATVTVSGQHWVPGQQVTVNATIALTGGTNTVIPQTATPDASGNFSVQITLPPNAVAGQDNIVAQQVSGGSTLTAATRLTVTTLTPALSLTPSTVTAGGAVAVSGTGFLAGSPVTITAQVVVGGGTQTVTVNATPDASGAFTVALVVPPGAASGPITVQASQAGSGVTTSTTLAVQAATTPTPTSTPVPTSTPIPTPSPTTTEVPHVAFRYVTTLHHVVHAGKTNRIDAQANLSQTLVIWVHINFPTGRHFDYISKTDSSGHWTKTFTVPRGATNRYSNRVYVHFQLWNAKDTAKTFGSFLIK